MPRVDIEPTTPGRFPQEGAAGDDEKGIVLTDTLGPDGELIAACAEAERASAHLVLLNQRDTICSDAHMSDSDDALMAAFERVAELPATTTAGFRAKIAVLRLAALDAVVDREPGWKSIEDGDVHERMTIGLCDDIIAAGLCADIIAAGIVDFRAGSAA
jgi:hypothetical protein